MGCFENSRQEVAIQGRMLESGYFHLNHVDYIVVIHKPLC